MVKFVETSCAYKGREGREGEVKRREDVSIGWAQSEAGGCNEGVVHIRFLLSPPFYLHHSMLKGSAIIVIRWIASLTCVPNLTRF